MISLTKTGKNGSCFFGLAVLVILAWSCGFALAQEQIYDKEITAFFNRVEDLSPDIAVFFVDTELRMKDKIVPMFEDALLKRYNKAVPVERIVKELFHINKKIFIINSKGGITTNIETVLAFKWHKEFDLT